MTPFSKEHNQRTLNLLAERGRELTPEQLDIERAAAFNIIRKELRKKGYDVPEDDAELFKLIQLTATLNRHL